MSTSHNVRRGPAQGFAKYEEIPCDCAATMDHSIGNEVVPLKRDKEFASLLQQYEEAASAYGHWSTLRETAQDTIDYWRNRTDDLRVRLLATATPLAKSDGRGAVDDLPGMWDHSDLSGGATDHNGPRECEDCQRAPCVCMTGGAP